MSEIESMVDLRYGAPLCVIQHEISIMLHVGGHRP